jgi:Skp family chaperone for outer membrane proteins
MMARKFLLAIGLVLCAPALVFAQAADLAPAQTAARSPILTLDQEALYDRSLFGQALRARVTAAVAEIEAQSRATDAQLEAEERALTVQRAGMTPEEFAPLAAAFDQKVQRLRAENAAAADAVRVLEQQGRQEFIAAAAQVIGDYMVERGAAAIIDKGAVIVSLLGLDVTDEVVARIDAVLGDGSAVLDPQTGAPPPKP